MLRENHSLNSYDQSVKPLGARNATVTGGDVDTKNFGSATAVIDSGTITDGTHTPTLEESDVGGGSGYTTVVAADLQGSFVDVVTDSIQKVGYIGNKQFIRVVITVAGATTGGVYSANITKSHALGKPAA